MSERVHKTRNRGAKRHWALLASERLPLGYHMIRRYTPKGRNPPCSYGSDFKPRKLRVTNQWQRFECRESSCETEPEPETEMCREATLAPPAGARLLTDLIHVPIPQGILARAAQRKGLLHADEELRRTTNTLDQPPRPEPEM